MLLILQRVVFNTKLSQKQFSTASVILCEDFMQNAVSRKKSLKFGKRLFLTQNEVKKFYKASCIL